MFTVIIPLYNKATYIEDAIKSVLNQTYKEFELIIVEDGSKDDSLQIVNKLYNTLSHPWGGWRIVEQANSGVSTARNNGVKLAKYDYIAFLDADDWWAQTYLEEMKGLIEQYPEAGMYGSSYYKVKSGKYITAVIGVPMGFQHGLINYFQVYAQTLWMPITSISSIITKAVFNEKNGFNPSLKLGEDFDLWVRIAAKYPVAFLNKPLAYYNQDVELATRAVGVRLYEPHEHMLFAKYDKELTSNPDFVYLFERLALYGLLPYYLNNKNSKETKTILSRINIRSHESKYWWYYLYLPKFVVQGLFLINNMLHKVKSHLQTLFSKHK